MWSSVWIDAPLEKVWARLARPEDIRLSCERVAQTNGVVMR
jgi:hypothetical protein